MGLIYWMIVGGLLGVMIIALLHLEVRELFKTLSKKIAIFRINRQFAQWINTLRGLYATDEQMSQVYSMWERAIEQIEGYYC